MIPPASRRPPGGFRSGLLLCLAALWLAGAAAAEDPHEFSDIGCDACHLGEEPDKVPREAKLKPDVDEQCISCHGACFQGKKHQGSPGSAGSMKSRLPLDGRSEIACYTCHDPHLGSQDRKSGAPTRYLRITNRNRELCLNCHRVGGKS